MFRQLVAFMLAVAVIVNMAEPLRAEVSVVPSGSVRNEPPPIALPNPAPSLVPNDPDDKTLWGVRLGDAQRDVLGRLGEPEVKQVGATGTFAAYSEDNYNAWLVVLFKAKHVVCVQIMKREHLKPSVHDHYGVRLGDPAASILEKRPDFSFSTSHPWYMQKSENGVVNFYGIDKLQEVERFGITLSNVEEPAYIRWFQNNGMDASRPYRISAMVDSEVVAHETDYISHTSCGFGLTFWPISRTSNAKGDQVEAQCANSNVRRPFYFRINTPGAAQVASIVSRFGSGISGKTIPLPMSSMVPGKDGSLIKLPSASATLPPLPKWYRRAGRHRLSTVPPPDNNLVWMLPTNRSGGEALFRRFSPADFNGQFDMYFNAINNAANPLQSTELAYMDPAVPAGFYPRNTAMIKHRAAQARRLAIKRRLFKSPLRNVHSLTKRLALTTTPPPQNCILPKCFGPMPPGPSCPNIQAQYPGGTAQSQCVQDPGCSQVNTCPNNPSPCPGSGFGGDPIDFINGTLKYHHDDVSLSGPFGLKFSRTYNSQGLNYSADLGVGWHHNYSAFLDLTYVNTLFSVTRYSDCGNAEAFVLVSPGLSSYDPIEGSTLTENGDGSFTLTSKQKTVETYNSGGALTSIVDRVGNTQTVNRDSTNDDRITSVTDALGRSLLFSYDSQNRILSMTSSPTGISVTMQYDTGTNCVSGELCAVTESDGSAWSYQYAQSPAAHLLSQVNDPLGHIVEQDVYQMYQSTPVVVQQEADSGANKLSISYNFASYASMTASCPTGPSCTINTVTDGLGRVTTYSADAGSRSVVSIAGPGCGCVSYAKDATYDVFGRLRSDSDLSNFYNGPKNVYYYDNDVLYTTPDGSTTYTLKAVPKVTEHDQPNYDSAGDTRATDFTYYPTGDARDDLVQTMTQPSVVYVGGTAAVRTATYNFATNGTLTSETDSGYTNASTVTSYTRSFTYDTRGRVLTETGPRTDLTQTTKFAYYSDQDTNLARRGQPMTITDALGHSDTLANGPGASASYDLYGNPLSETDANGVTTTASYDALGRMVQASVLPAQSGDQTLTTTLTRDKLGRIAAIKKPRGNQILVDYDNNNNEISVTLADINGNQYEQKALSYDAMGQPIAESSAACTNPSSACSWITTQNVGLSRDATGRVTQIRYGSSNGSISTISYVASGPGQGLVSNVVTSSGSNTLKSSSATYDFEGRTLTQNADATTLSFSYDLGDHTTQLVTAAAGNTALLGDTKTYSYDDFDRMITENVDALALIGNAYTYDANGNTLTVNQANGSVKAFTYDALDRPLTEKASPGTPSSNTLSSTLGLGTSIPPTATLPIANENITWSYDNATPGSYGIGRVAQMTDPSGSTSYAYERRGLLTSKSQSVSTAVAGTPLASTTYKSGFAYDANGKLSSDTYPSGRIVSYTYDYADRPSSVSSANRVYVSQAHYEPFGPLMSIAYGNGTTALRSYDQGYRFVENKLTSATGISLSDQLYTFDGLSRLTQISDQLTPTDSKSISYLNGQLRESQSSGLYGNAVLGTDGFGNAESSSFSNYNGASHSIVLGFNGTNDERPTTVTTDGGAPLPIVYDLSGNEKTVGASAYLYSARNLLQSGDGIAYTYDGAGTRTTSSGATLGIKTSLYDNGRLNSEFQPALGNVLGAYQHDYIYLGDLPVAQEDVVTTALPTTGVVTPTSATGTRFTFDDNLGAPTIQTNSAGSIIWQADYEPNGRVYALRTAYSHQPLRRRGQESEEFDGDLLANANGSTPRYYNGARWYRPTWYRYTQSDPAGASGGHNVYSYAKNLPLEHDDPQGLTAAAIGVLSLDLSLGELAAGGEAALGILGEGIAAAVGGVAAVALAPEVLAAAALIGAATLAALAVQAALSSGALADVNSDCRSGSGGGGNNGGNGTNSNSPTNGSGTGAGNGGGSGGSAGGNAADNALYSGGSGPVFAGQRGVNQALQDLPALGYTPLATQVTIDAGGSTIVADIVAFDSQGNIVLIEVKNGANAGFSANQQAGYGAVSNVGGVTRGANANMPGLGSGVPLGPTPVVLMHYVPGI